MKVALLQLCANADKAKNIAQALAMCKEALAHKVEFVVLPEIFNFRGDLRNKEILRSAAEKIPGPSTKVFAALAQEHKANILLGSIIEKTTVTPPGGVTGAGFSRAYNTSVFIDPRGKLAAKYRKIHLFDARIGDKIVRESECFLPGQGGKRVKVGEFSAGLSICYDLRFPQMYRQYAAQGVEILAIPSCFTKKTGEAHWETLLRARAIENLSYVLAPNQVGMDARGMEAYGHSMIISPWGKIIARGSAEAQEIVYGDIEMEEVLKARQILPGIIKIR